MSRCPNCDTPLHITRAASPVIESESAYTYRTGVLMQQTPPKSSETEKVPTPASDSVKGEHCPHSATTEKDRHGRSIIARNDYAIVVEVGNEFLVTNSECTHWYSELWGKWVVDDEPMGSSAITREIAMRILAKAAATPLPKPAEVAKVEAMWPAGTYPYDNKEIEMPAKPEAKPCTCGYCDNCERAKECASLKPFAFNGPIESRPTPAEFSDLRLRVSDLETKMKARDDESLILLRRIEALERKSESTEAAIQ